ncbi:unnamed protein product [Musa acuminata subsp. malaccensis]|uniref:(wild Malaysian banana) hypothetical protein n=1 Tax=Musa acuminata subsp. malaccensis TaxID=214687 RepID=A0A8D7AFH3_MUSAM|nr:unnamed protein product [Musa acuminata subsp. malaccensis]
MEGICLTLMKSSPSEGFSLLTKCSGMLTSLSCCSVTRNSSPRGTVFNFEHDMIHISWMHRIAPSSTSHSSNSFRSVNISIFNFMNPRLAHLSTLPWYASYS